MAKDLTQPVNANQTPVGDLGSKLADALKGKKGSTGDAKLSKVA
jgi:hypothetical protein